ncbi:MAG: PIN domain-containing protein [Thermoleophilia bacterium]|nr:PIN domain-containing protein [Thermoleophilia bacterium]
MSTQLVLDSSCWISWIDEYDHRSQLVDDVVASYDGALAVPAIVIFEVDRWMRRNAFPDDARRKTLVLMSNERVIPIDAQVAIHAGVVARSHRLATADALIAGAAHIAGCDLATFDRDFIGLPGVVILPNPAQSE